MKKLYCSVSLFELHQKIYLLDQTSMDKAPCVAITTMEDLPKIMSSLCAERGISDVVLDGNRRFATSISQEILEYSKLNYNNLNINVEVM